MTDDTYVPLGTSPPIDWHGIVNSYRGSERPIIITVRNGVQFSGTPSVIVGPDVDRLIGLCEVVDGIDRVHRIDVAEVIAVSGWWL